MLFKLMVGYICEPIIWGILGISIWIFIGRVGYYMMIDVNDHYNYQSARHARMSFTKYETFLLGPMMLLVAFYDYIAIMYSRIKKEIAIMKQEKEASWDK